MLTVQEEEQGLRAVYTGLNKQGVLQALCSDCILQSP